MGKTIKKILNAFTTILVCLVILLAILLVGARLIGLQVFTVLSGSMEPTYHVGALIYVKDVDPYQLESGDVITFMLDEDEPSTIRFRTKGDANDSEDGSLVHYKNVVGTPVFTIPRLGYVANYIQHPPGTYVAISAGAILLLLVFLPDLFGDEKKEPKPEAGEPAKPQRKKKGGKYAGKYAKR